MSLATLFRKRQRRACHLKEKIRCEKRAAQIVASAIKRDGVPWEWYRCCRCGQLHVGHSSLLANTVRGAKAQAEAERKASS